jgi:ferritin-like metal-binding protein YciE
MTPAENLLTEWLHDAQAMEKQAEVMLNALAEGIEHYPDVKAQIERHFQQAREEAAALQAHVERFREGAPTWKEAAGQCVVMGQGLSGAFAGGNFVKRAIAEISCYNVLIVAAAGLGDDETRVVCEDILRREETMLNWLKNYLASATARYLDLEEKLEGETTTLPKS